MRLPGYQLLQAHRLADNCGFFTGWSGEAWFSVSRFRRTVETASSSFTKSKFMVARCSLRVGSRHTERITTLERKQGPSAGSGSCWSCCSRGRTKSWTAGSMASSSIGMTANLATTSGNTGDSTKHMVPGHSIVTMSFGDDRVFRLRPWPMGKARIGAAEAFSFPAPVKSRAEASRTRTAGRLDAVAAGQRWCQKRPYGPWCV